MFRQLRTVALLVSALLVLSAGAASAAEVIPEAETMFLDHINASRAEEGHAPLTMNTELSSIARDWSHVMQAEDRMYHNPSYSQQYTGQWESMGENVGTMYWPSGQIEQMVQGLHDAFMDSPGHRRNIMGDYNQAGIGVVRHGDDLWVTVNFLRGEVPAQDGGQAEPEVERFESAPPGEDAPTEQPEERPNADKPYYSRR
jgi:uncharacterized protein YkwD